MAPDQLRLGIAGLGRAFMLMLPTFVLHPAIRLVAAADPRPEAQQRFSEDFSARCYATVEELCDDPGVDAVYIASPHQHHAAHVAAAAAGGKHVLVEKPMALNLEDCRRMIDAARQAGVHLIVGHSHSFDQPYRRARELIASGAFGSVRMITACNFTDFLYRPRRPEELVTDEGGGVVFNQAAHQVDIVRLLGGGWVRSVRALTGSWDAARPTEGAYSALLSFDDGAFASLTYSGYAHFDTDEFCGWVGELGQRRDANVYGTVRKQLRSVGGSEEEAALKNQRAYGARGSFPAIRTEQKLPNHFGLVVASCDHADLRPMPQGIMVYGNEARECLPLRPQDVPRVEVVDELLDAVMRGRQPLHSGEWGLATLEVCLAILQSAHEGREIRLHHQVGMRL
jgi:phthalate 4,5-cis-dihydrodiol dehydrogenase